MRIRCLALAFLTLATAACSNQLGRDIPECDRLVTNSIIVEIQSVPSAAFVPCINALRIGWTYHHVEPRSGRSVFHIESDRFGDEFLTITTTATCDVTGAEPVPSDEWPIELFSATTADFAVPIVVIPEVNEGPTLEVALTLVRDLFGVRFNERMIDATVDRDEVSVTDRIERAHRAGSHVIVVGVRDAEDGTVSLRLAGETDERTLGARQAIDTIEDTVSAPSYRGVWYYRFEGGCTEYRFDAAGPGVETIESEVRGAFGFVDTAQVKDLARSAGYEIP
jgi:hypothetical protein